MNKLKYFVSYSPAVINDRANDTSDNMLINMIYQQNIWQKHLAQSR